MRLRKNLKIRRMLKSMGLGSYYKKKELIRQLMDIDLIEIKPILESLNDIETIPPNTSRDFIAAELVEIVFKKGIDYLRGKMTYASPLAIINKHFEEAIDTYGEETIKRLLKKVPPKYQDGFIGSLFPYSTSEPRDINKVETLLDANVPADQIYWCYEIFDTRLNLELSQRDKPKIQKTIKFYGEVQGVEFRGTCAIRGDKYGVRGFARNEKNGSVTVLAQGYEEAIRMFVEDIRNKMFKYIRRVEESQNQRIEKEYDFFHELYFWEK